MILIFFQSCYFGIWSNLSFGSNSICSFFFFADPTKSSFDGQEEVPTGRSLLHRAFYTEVGHLFSEEVSLRPSPPTPLFAHRILESNQA